MVGGVPQSVIDDQEEFVQSVHTTSFDLVKKNVDCVLLYFVQVATHSGVSVKGCSTVHTYIYCQISQYATI